MESNQSSPAPQHRLVGQLRELMKKATQGPLYLGEYGDIKAPGIGKHDKLPLMGVSMSCGSVQKSDPGFANRDLIVAAVNALPALLAIAEAAELASVEIASTGYPKDDKGRYAKGGEWDFSEMTRNDNVADAEAVKKAFLLLDAALSLLPNAKGQPAATEPAKQAGRGPLGCADLLGADVLPERKP